VHQVRVGLGEAWDLVRPERFGADWMVRVTDREEVVEEAEVEQGELREK